MTRAPLSVLLPRPRFKLALDFGEGERQPVKPRPVVEQVPRLDLPAELLAEVATLPASPPIWQLAGIERGWWRP